MNYMNYPQVLEPGIFVFCQRSLTDIASDAMIVLQEAVLCQ